jgi:hypothetical protein
MRRPILVAVVVVLTAGARAQAVDAPPSAPVQSGNPTLYFDPAALPSVTQAPLLEPKPINPNDSIFTRIDLGGSTLNFEGDRKPPDNRLGAETFEPGTLMSRKSRKLGPNYFGLSIKKPLESN